VLVSTKLQTNVNNLKLEGVSFDKCQKLSFDNQDKVTLASAKKLTLKAKRQSSSLMMIMNTI
jgi:hypothetical protein